MAAHHADGQGAHRGRDHPEDDEIARHILNQPGQLATAGLSIASKAPVTRQPARPSPAAPPGVSQETSTIGTLHTG